MADLGYEDYARIALAYVLEDENYQNFIAWVAAEVTSISGKEFAANPPDIWHLRDMWIQRSPAKLIRGMVFIRHVDTAETTASDASDSNEPS